ncbi:spore-associated protein A [Streptomyces sp. NPDC050145]|uniref:spore-associated protein A n=1 Tax=Streptomyces sp. NPDC050145 TaxID=3365602 RepID=UPI0037A603C9
MRMRRLGGIAATFGLAAAGLVFSATPAAAAGYNGACGSGYNVIGSKDVGQGIAYVTYNSSNGYNCVVTVNDDPGTARYLDARLRVHRTDTVWKSNEMDAGTFAYYAGPVYVYAKGHCIDYGGEAGSNSYVQIDYGVHCG